MDVLSDVLEASRLKSVIFGRLELTAPWGFRSDRGDPGFYVVTRGSCWLEMDGMDPVALVGGDFVLLPRGQVRTLKDNRRTRALPVSEIFAKCPESRRCQPGGVLRHGGGGALTTIVAG